VHFVTFALPGDNALPVSRTMGVAESFRAAPGLPQMTTIDV
jgi:hypothetical protein